MQLLEGFHFLMAGLHEKCPLVPEVDGHVLLTMQHRFLRVRPESASEVGNIFLVSRPDILFAMHTPTQPSF